MYGVVGTDGVVYGPVPVTALFEWIAQGRVVPSTTLIDHRGRHLMAAALPELQGAFPAPAPLYVPGYPRPDAVPYLPGGKSKRAALWYAFLLGFLGAHRFYLGHPASGFVMLVLNLLVCGTGLRMGIVLAIVTTVWLVVDMALIGAGRLVGKDGRPLA